jgi:TRAP transporter TAXI family solute receptor
VSFIAVALVLVGFLVAYQFVDPAPPGRIVLATGSDGGAYQRYGEKFADYLAANGIQVTLRESAGSVENLQLLSADSGVDVAFVQGGLADSVDSSAVMSIGSLYLEPLWLFVRRDLELGDMSDLAGARISVGVEGSGTRIVANTLLAAHGITRDAADFIGVEPDELAQAFVDDQLDAAFVIADPGADLIADLLQTSAVELRSLERADAYARRYSYLTSISLPEGVLDLRTNRPNEDIETVALTATLVARRDFHPALVSLLLLAATSIHGEHSILADSGEFPTGRYVDLPLNEDAQRYFKNGPPFLMRYLPFWAATLVDRMWIMLFPIIGLAIPLVKLVPPVYQWRIRRKILRVYSELEQLDPKGRAVTSDADRSRRILALGNLDNQTLTVSVPHAYKDDLYKLRRDIDLVRRQVLEADLIEADVA